MRRIAGSVAALVLLAGCGGNGSDVAETKAPSVATTSVAEPPPTANLPSSTVEDAPPPAPTTTGVASPTSSTSAPGGDGVEIHEVDYFAGDERFLGGGESVDVVVPAALNGSRPVVVIFSGDPRVAGKKWVRPMAIALAQKGRVVFVPDWGHTSGGWKSEANLKQQWDSLIAKGRCAVVFAHAMADEYGGDPDHITVMGYSAGGNMALMVAMSDIEPLDACAASGPGVEPQAVVSIEGDLLIGAPDWDRRFEEDSEAFYSFAPWRLIEATDRFPVHILAADTTAGAQRYIGESDPYTTFLVDRHADIDLIAALSEMGILDDGVFSNLEAQQWAYRTLSDAGYETTWALLPESRHATLFDPNWAMSDEAWQLTIDTVLNAENRAS